MNKKVLITGATGFLGSAVVNDLVKSDFKVFATVRNLTKMPLIHENLIYVDLSKKDSLTETFGSQNIDTVLHLATKYGRNGETIQEILEANLLLPLEILNLAVNSGAKHFINIDSFYNKPGNTQKRLFDYSQSKAALLPWLQMNSDKIRVSNLILEHMYGPNDKRDKFIPRLIRSAKSNYNDGLKLSPGDQRRDFIYIDDVVSAIHKILNSPAPIRNYENVEVGMGETNSLKELAAVINGILNLKSNPPFNECPYPADEIMLSVADNSILKSLGWKPIYDLESGIRKILEEQDA